MPEIIDIRLNLHSLKSLYDLNPSMFVESLQNSESGSVFRKIVEDIAYTAIFELNSISNSTIAQLDMDGNMLLSSGLCKFSNTKEEIKYLGASVFKMDNMFLVADSVNKKALIVNNELSKMSETIISNYWYVPSTTEEYSFIDIILGNISGGVGIPTVVWQYDSDKYITSFELVRKEEFEVIIRDDGVENRNASIRQGSKIKWINNSCKPISIYSGTTTNEQFQLVPDLTLYGKEFKSQVLQPGESYSHKFITTGIYSWFIYPDILTGRINVTNDRINSNDEFIIVENDNTNSPYTSRIIKINTSGDILWSFGESYISSPRKAKSLLNGNILTST